MFLETLAQAVERDRLRVNTWRSARVFANPAFGFRTCPVGVRDLARWIRTRRHGPRRDVAALNGLHVTADTLPRDVRVQLFEGAVTFRGAAKKRENVNND